jgi:agmatinase
MPATGTPEPGGLLWDETLNIIKKVVKILILLVLILMN